MKQTQKKSALFCGPGQCWQSRWCNLVDEWQHTPLSKSHYTVSTTRKRTAHTNRRALATQTTPIHPPWDGRRRRRFRLCSGSSRDQLTFSDSFCTFDRRQREGGVLRLALRRPSKWPHYPPDGNIASWPERITRRIS